MKAYSTDLRERIVQARQSGQTQARVAQRYQVSESTVKRIMKHYHETGRVAAKRRTVWKRLIGTPDAEQALLTQLVAYPDDTLAGHVHRWEVEQGQQVSVATMHRAIRRMGVTYQKR